MAVRGSLRKKAKRSEMQYQGIGEVLNALCVTLADPKYYALYTYFLVD